MAKKRSGVDKELEVFDKKRKTMAFLMRRGYSSDIVRKALDAVQQKPEDDWE